MAPALARVTLKPRMARPFFARHPWVFSGSIGRVEGDPEPGAEVEVVAREGTFVARGLFNPASQIRVRLYRWDGGPLDDDFWRAQLERAVALRRALRPEFPAAGAERLVFSEADGLSGLTVDRYDRWLVAQFTGLGLYARRDVLLAVLTDLVRPEGIVGRRDRTTAHLEGLAFDEGPILGMAPDGPVLIEEHGLTYAVDLRAGQKTGAYLDQRDNRRAAASYAAGLRVLDLYCHAGGFALNALKHGGATEAIGVETSAGSVELARENASRNGLEPAARFLHSEALTAVTALKTEGQRFGMVVVDPPKFARSPHGVEDALRAYLGVNRAAVTILEPGGILVTCSCSAVVDRIMFAQVLGRVAEQEGRPIQILEQRGPSPDHPVSASCLETDYLKCFICRVG